ncbi:MAG: hypothetical protein A2591_01010 [Candidatus Yonathbacteria bacterium RIFOXYD1_FULL_52_36]|uniref:DUF4395 domain-containing protein n=1 Tax=Candidatus Yonathbacteria bacterium RIFOXYD1_FULL_52_36 TaxID=1802730 RepID=A0A1G2SJM6_9BACT|nr:MAG: hypothetical protein A2591_01010 [Candidatus Yonathbacteria bacterium RIFOXYD1_FULL_52_36]
MNTISPRTCAHLDAQGYTAFSTEEKIRLNLPLRFTPTVCSVGVVVGMVLGSWEVFAVLSIFGILGTIFPKGQPVDVLYNTLFYKLFRTPKLPPAPPQKRFACALGAAFLIGATYSFFVGATTWGYGFGVGYIVAAGLMATTHWCVGSWLYNKIFGAKLAQ